MRGLEFFLLGYGELEIDMADSPRFLNLCKTYGILYTPVRDKRDKDCMRVRCRMSVCKRIVQLAEGENLAVRQVLQGGLPMIVYRYRLRTGILFGILLSLSMLFLSGRLVWDIRFEEGDNINQQQLEQQLAACGLRVGSWIPHLSMDEIENRMLTTTDNIAWITVNLRGTVAYVQARALMKPEENAQKDVGVTNLVAKCDGVIDSVRLLSGTVAVEQGQLVRAGELLVSGVRDSNTLGYSVTPAKGEVMACTEHTLVVQIPLQQSQKRYTEVKNGEKILFFFGNPIKLSKKTGIVGGNCDTIKKLEIFSLFRLSALPLSLESTELHYYEWQTVNLSEEQAARLAQEELNRRMIEELQGAMLLSKTVSFATSEEYYTLSCQYRCIENIAQEQQITVDPAATP